MKLRHITGLLVLATIITLCPAVRAEGGVFNAGGADSLARASVRPEWSLDFRTVFDNREGDRTYTADRTFFFTQLAPEVGLSIDRGRHRVMGGVVWTQPIGCEWDGHRISPTLYYLYGTRRWHFAMGMVPRTQLVRELPNFIVSDSVRYFQRNLRSAMVTYDHPSGSYFQALLDWRGMQSDTRREAFSIVADGEWRHRSGIFMLGGTVMMNHLAKQRNAPPDQHVVDNLLANVWAGADLAGLVGPLSALDVRVGPISSLTRDRGDSDWITSAGIWARINVAWWRLRLENTLYAAGKPLFPLYGRYGSMLSEGEPFYAAKFYDRLSVTGELLRWRGCVGLDASLDFNITPAGMIFYQRVMLRVDF